MLKNAILDPANVPEAQEYFQSKFMNLVLVLKMFYLSQIKFLLFRSGPNGETKQFLFFPPCNKSFILLCHFFWDLEIADEVSDSYLG